MSTASSPTETSPLAAAIAAFVAARGNVDGFHPTPLDGVSVACSREPTRPIHVTSVPSLCIVAQGAKTIMHGKESKSYAAMQFLYVPVDMPLVSTITSASRERPFYGLIVELDLNVLLDVIGQLGPERGRSDDLASPRLSVHGLEDELADTIRRLVVSLDRPSIARALYPSLMREVCVWLVVASRADALRGSEAASGVTLRIATAVRAMRADLTRPLRLKDLATIACMSVSSFHQHFSSLTAMTPIQFQKQLRLIEARRLMMTDRANVGEAARLVGYESPSQFSRDYSRMFGNAPKRDALAAPARA